MCLKVTVKRAACMVLALIMLVAAAGCGENKETTKKKKKIITKKVVIVETDDNSVTVDDTSSATDNYQENDNTVADDDFETVYVRREVTGEVANQVEPQEKQFSTEKASLNITNEHIIVYSDENVYAHQNAVNLQNYFSKEGLNLTVAEDDKVSWGSKLIVVGDTKFAESKLTENAFAVTAYGDNLLFAGGNFAMVETAVNWFTALAFEKGKVNLVSGTVSSFSATKTTSRGTYDYVWGDEFSGNYLDTNKWRVGLMTTPESTLCATPDNCPEAINVSDGLLKTKAMRYYNDEYPQYQYAKPGSISTDDSMGYLFGYAELRARMTFKRGVWPAWWGINTGCGGLGTVLGPANPYDYGYEIDIFEVLSSESTLTPNIHKWYKDNSYGRTHTQYNEGYRQSNRYVFEDISNLNNEYHTYGFEWTDKEMIMSVDGDEYWTVNLDSNYDGLADMEALRNSPIKFILGPGICASDNGDAQESWILNNEDLPFYFWVDYIRLYQNKQQSGNKLYVKDADGEIKQLWN